MAVSVAADLARYLDDVAGRPFAWGQYDCGVGLVAGWVERARGLDLAVPFRGAYGSGREAAKLLVREGGMIPLFDRLAAQVGIARTAFAAIGDVGVLRARTPADGVRPVGAIRTGIGWAVLAEHGVTIGLADALAIWRL